MKDQKEKVEEQDSDMHAKPPFRVGAKVGMHIDAPPIIFQRAKELRQRETNAEKILWEELKGKKLDGFKFRRQHPMMNYILDFYCYQYKLAIELDGNYHFTEEQKELDRLRSLAIENYGITVMRFTNTEVEKKIESVKKETQLAIKTKMENQS